MDVNPVLVEAWRGGLVESRHRGAFVVCEADGTVIVAAGDISTPVFPRSAVKAMQALALFATGAVDRFGMSDEEIALACASHHGEEVHTRRVANLLERLGLGPQVLECGAHQPNNDAARHALREAGAAPSARHNNCSGKHAGMLADTLALGAAPAGYVERTHPTQVAVRGAIERAIGQELSEDRVGIDGCSIPTWAAPLRAFATGFARMATGKGLSPDDAAAAQRIFDAATANPLLVAGTGHFDTVVMEAFGGRIMHKGGAEGVQCGAIRDLSLGYAIKCETGNMAASQIIAAELLLALSDPDDAERAVLEEFRSQPLLNVRKIAVGDVRGSEALKAALAG